MARRTFPEALEEYSIDPDEWKEARAGEYGEYSKELATEVEDIILGQELDYVIELEPGETLLDVLGIMFTAAAAWPLSKKEKQ